MLKKLSYVLIVIGTIGASICAAKTLPNQEGWQSAWQVHTVMFAGYIVMMAAGILFSRIKSNPLLEIHAETETKTPSIQTYLTQAQMQLKALDSKTGSLSTQELYLSLGKIMEETLEPFVEKRGDLIDQYGMAKYALVFTPFAQAERYLNRAWSAAVDGYKEESTEYLSRSLPLLLETNDILKQLLQPSELKSK